MAATRWNSPRMVRRMIFLHCPVSLAKLDHRTVSGFCRSDNNYSRWSA